MDPNKPMWPDQAAEIDDAILALCEGLASRKASARIEAAEAFVKQFQTKDDLTSFYRGESIADAYDSRNGLAWATWFPHEFGQDEFGSARKSLFEVLLLMPGYASDTKVSYHQQQARLDILAHGVAYLQARNIRPPIEVLLCLADGPADSWKKEVDPPEHPLAQRVLLYRALGKYEHLSEKDLAKELAREGEDPESATRALRNYRERWREAAS